MEFDRAIHEGLSSTLINKVFNELSSKEDKSFRDAVKALLKEYPSVRSIILRDTSGNTFNSEMAKDQLNKKIEHIKTGFEKEFGKKPPKNANKIVKEIALELKK